MSQSKYTPTQLTPILEAYQSGLPIADIEALAIRSGVNPSSLDYHFRKAGLPPRESKGAPPKLTPEQVGLALATYQEGGNITVLARSMGVTEGALFYHIKKAGIELTRGRTGRPIVSGADQTHYPCGMCKQTLPREAFGSYKAKRGVRPCSYICKACAVKRRAMSQYKITLDQYEHIHAAGACQVCQAPKPANRTLFIDHCHTSGKVRGLLCEPCNSALGSAKENKEVLLQAKQYLENPIKSIPEAPELPLTTNQKWRLRKVFKISPEQYAGLIQLQGGCCAVCKGELKKPVVDHCHTTEAVRGVLCWDCNILLGKVKDSTKVLDGLISYLDNPPFPLGK